MTRSRCGHWLALLALWSACVADPSLPLADMAIADDLGAVDAAGAVPLIAWEPRRGRITGARTSGVAASSDHFVVGASGSGVFRLDATGTPVTTILPSPAAEWRLLGIENDLPLVASSGALLRGNSMPGWDSIALGLPSSAVASHYVASSSYRFLFLPLVGLYRSVSLDDGAGFGRINQSPLSKGLAVRDAATVYLGKTNGVVTFANSAPMNDIVITGTGGLSVQALRGGARILAGGISAGTTRIKEIVQLDSSDCGDAIAGSVAIVDVFSTANLNVAVGADNRVYTNQDCAGPWARGGSFFGTYQGGDVLSDGTIVIGSSHSVFRSSDSGATLIDVPIESASVWVTSLAANPGDRSHLVIGTDGRGVWESHNAGETWIRLEPPTFNGELQTTVQFTAPDTILVAADYNGGASANGGVYRGVFANAKWSFERQAVAAVGQPPFSATVVAASPSLGLLACFESPSPLQRYSGGEWQELTPLASSTACASIASSGDGQTHWIGGVGSIVALHGTTPAALTSETLVVPNNSGIVRGVLSLDDAGSRILVQSDNGAFVLDATGAHEVLYGGVGLGAVTAIYRDTLSTGVPRLWVASANEPLLISDDGAQSWVRVPSTGNHPVIYRLERVDNLLYAASLTNVWRATLP